MQKSRFRDLFILCTYTVILVFVVFHMGEVQGQFGWILSILTPFIYGFVMAFVLNHPLMFLQKRIFGPIWRAVGIKSEKGVKVVALISTYLLLILGVSTLFSIVLPQLANSVASLVGGMPGYLNSFNGMINSFLETYPLDATILTWMSDYWAEILSAITQAMSNILPRILDAATGITTGISNLTVGFVVSIYLLLAKDRFVVQGKQLLYAFVPERYCDKVLEIARLVNRTFGGFISGQLTVSVIVGILCFAGMMVFKMPYALLCSVIVGVTNVIPYFGPFLGAIPCIFILLVESPLKALGFVVMIFIIQQTDGNFLSPKIVGNSIGLSGVWVLFAILVGGSLWGIVGMVVGLPTFAVFYALLRELTYYRLSQRHRSRSHPEEKPPAPPATPPDGLDPIA